MNRELYADRLEMLSASTGIGIGLFDAAGTRIMISGAGCDFCREAATSAECVARCARFHADAGRKAADLGEAYMARCPLGAVAITSPVFRRGIYDGSAAFMPVRMWAWDAEARSELMRAIADLGLDPVAMIEAGGKMPEIDAGRSRALMELIAALVTPDIEDMEVRRLVNSQQRQIGEMISSVKTGSELRVYPMHIEREMLERVRFGDRKGARALLNELLGHVFLRAPGNMKLMKARVLELVVVISRAAVESGAEMEALLGLNYDYVAELSSVTSYEDLCVWVVRMLETFLDTVERSCDTPGSSQLGDAMNYIRKNFSQGLTLEDVAEHSLVSPYYLSHLFRERLGLTFVEYLTSVRVETARNYLAGTKLPIAVIAERIGYDDPGYFARVFKKNVGMTPMQYRKTYQ